MPRLPKVALTLLALSALVSVPWSAHELVMLISRDNFGWGIFAVFFFDAPLALGQLVLATILTVRATQVPRWVVLAGWAVTGFTAITAGCVVAFGKASGC